MAIAFDAATDGGFVAAGTSLTFSHTCTGSNRALFVQAFTNAGATISGVTYAGVSMTQVASVAPDASRTLYLFYLTGPASGANNVVISASVSTFGGNAASYTGVSSGAIDASTTRTATASPDTTTLTTIADNCWTVLVSTCSSGGAASVAASTNSTLRKANGTFVDSIMFDNNAAITPAGSYSMTLTYPTAPIALGTIMASFAPFTVSPVFTKNIITRQAPNRASTY